MQLDCLHFVTVSMRYAKKCRCIYTDHLEEAIKLTVYYSVLILKCRVDDRIENSLYLIKLSSGVARGMHVGS